MAKLTLSKLGLKTNINTIEAKINDDLTLKVRNYLPIDEKAELIKFVVDKSVDENTGCFSPIRIEVFFGLALVKWYMGISFTEKQLQEAGKTYDLLYTNGVIDQLKCVIGVDFNVINILLINTINDITRYSSSFAGILNVANGESANLNENIQSILEKIKNKEGIETLSAIKDVVGTD